jgi:hypothetical protein
VFATHGDALGTAARATGFEVHGVALILHHDELLMDPRGTGGLTNRR